MKDVESTQTTEQQALNIPVVSGSYINTEIYNCLNKLSNSVGETITEYHWREFCELMKMRKN